MGLLASLPLVLGACGEDASQGAQVPPLPDYIENFDSRVRDLLSENHQRLTEDPGDPERWMDLGKAYEAHREAAQAEICYRSALRIEATNPRWWYRLAMAQEINDKVEEALSSLESSIALNDQYPPSHWRRGQWKLLLGDTHEARACFERALAIDPSVEAAQVGLGQVHMWLGEHAQAIALFESGNLLQGPNAAFVSRQLGTCYQRMGEVDKARSLLAGVTDAEPRFPDPWKAEVNSLQRGMAAINREARQLIASGEALRAIQELQAAHELEPKHIPILRTLGAAYSAAGQFTKAQSALEKAVAMDPTDLELAVDAIWARAMTGDAAGALLEVDKVIEQESMNHKAHGLRAQVLLDLGRGAEAIEAFALATKHGNKNPKLLVDIGRVQLQLGRLEPAMQSFVLAANQDPALQVAWIGQAIAGIELKRFDDAETAIERAASLTPTGAPEDPLLEIIRDQIATLRQPATAPPK